MPDDEVDVTLTRRQTNAVADLTRHSGRLGAYFSLIDHGHVEFLSHTEMLDLEQRLRTALHAVETR